MPSLNKRRPAVILDRDGTINEDTGYISDPGALRLIEGAAAAIKSLNMEDVKVIIISNQSGVARGYFSRADVRAVNDRLRGLLKGGGAGIDAFYFCPHHPDEGCGCRKPRPGLIRKAAVEHSIDLCNSYVVGDKATDIGLARNTGAKGILVLTGQGTSESGKLKAAPHLIARDIKEAVRWILDDLRRSRNKRCAYSL